MNIGYMVDILYAIEYNWFYYIRSGIFLYVISQIIPDMM